MRQLFTVVIIALLTQSPAMAENLLKAKTLNINAPDSRTILQDLEVKLSIRCRYKSRGFFPQSKSCGEKFFDLKIIDGQLRIPVVEKFSGLQGKKIDNYDISLSFYEGKNYLSSINTRGTNAIAEFNQLNDQFNLIRFDQANISVSYLGQNFFDTELTKVDRATLVFTVSLKESNELTSNILVVSPIETSWVRENLASYEGKPLLRDASQIELPASSYGYFSKRKPESINVSLVYSQLEDFSRKPKLRRKLAVPVEFDALSKLEAIDLE